MTRDFLEKRLECIKQRYVRQQERLETLQLSMLYNKESIKQIEYALNMMERVKTRRRPQRLIPKGEVADFIIYATCVYDRIQRRLRLQHLNYTYFCSVICSRYLFESCYHAPKRRFISPTTIVYYFKRERAR